MDKKNQQSKAKFGTLTAQSDANNDYSSDTAAGASTSSSMAEYGTLTAKADSNNDYGGKSASQNKGVGSQQGNQQSSQQGAKKSMPSKQK